MAIHEIRETINTTATSDNGQIIVQKKINLQHGMRHNIVHMDWFDDAISGATNTQQNFKMEVYLTNYPIILSEQVFHSGAGVGGPLAGDDQVLFKAHRLSWSSANAAWYNNEFPNQFLGSTPTFDFYTPELYFTIIWNNETTEDITRQFQQSIYLAVDSVEVNAVEYGMGLIREYNENQMRLLTSNGTTMTQAQVEGGFMGWQVGGIRPELMTGVDAPDNFFYSLAGYGASETMQTSTQLRDAVEASRTMVAFDEAFGDQATEAPDWFKVVVRDFGSLNTGPIRPNFPPVQKLNTGITLMV
jgi:hypothetical protein